MSNIDKQVLREEFQYMQEHYSDPADRERQLIYIAAEAMLDELETAESRIAELEAREVKLPERYEVEMCPTPSPDGDWYSREDVLAALKTAGINIRGEED